jgi:hypothetical protein
MILALLRTLLVVAAFALCGHAAAPARAGEAISVQEAYEIGLDAYLYLYPLVLMEITRAQATNIEPGKPPSRAPMNAFGHLSKELMIVSVPDTAGRYYLLPMLDMWTDVFAVVGKRTTGTQAGDYALVPPGWQGRLPDGVERIDAPTPTVWIIGRTQTNGTKDYPAVHTVQDGFHVRALSQVGGETRPPAPTFDPAIDMATPPPRQLGAMPAARFFTVAMDLLRRQGPHLADQPILARMQRLGLNYGAAFDFNAAAPAIQGALERAAADASKLMAERAPHIGRQANGWQISTDTIGVYGASYLKRAIVARTLLGANLPEDAVYPATSIDSDGRPLDGAHNYLIHFAKGELPPVSAFWSITLYDGEGYPVANALDRFAIGDRDGLAANSDGSLDLVISAADPGGEQQANWLPAPRGPFNLMLRLYGPSRSVVAGNWLPPPVQRLP